MAHPVLNEDWSEYDNKKIRDGRDRSRVSCEEVWEREYIAEKLKKHHPTKTKEQIHAAIKSCCDQGASRVREHFIDCVAGKL